MTHSRSRNGFVTALVLMAVLAAAVAVAALRIHMNMVHRRTVDQATRTRALLLAESALEEAQAGTCRMVNDPNAAGGLFDRFRVWGDIAVGEDFATSSFTFRVPVPRTVQLAPGFTVDVESEARDQLPIFRANDRGGLIVHRATVRCGRIQQVVERQYAFRVSLVSAMRPFDRVTLLIADAAGYFRGPTDGGPGLAELAEGMAAKWAGISSARRDAVRQLHLAVESRPVTDTSVDPDAGLPDEAVLAALAQPPAEIETVAAQLATRTRTLQDQGFLVAAHPMRRAVAGEARMALDELDWTRAVGPELEQASTLLNRLEADLTTLRGATGDAAIRAGAERASRSAQALDQQFERALARLAAITRDLRAFSPEEQETRAELERTLQLLDPIAWIARTYLRVKATDRSQSNGTLEDFLTRRGHPARPFNGIMLWDNPKDPLILRNFTISGKLVVVVTGDVEVAEVRKADPDSLLTVVALKRLTVRGTVQAALVGLGALEVAQGAQVEGNLIAREYSPGLEGAVTLDPRLSSGWNPALPAEETAAARRHYYVSMSPGPIAARVLHR